MADTTPEKYDKDEALDEDNYMEHRSPENFDETKDDDEMKGDQQADDEEDDEYKQKERDEMEEDLLPESEQENIRQREGDQLQDLVFEYFEFAAPEVEQKGAGISDKEDLSTEAGKWVPADVTATALVHSKHRFVCVDYPGIVRNKERAVATMGGCDKIQQACQKDGRLELFFRPEDPYCKPTAGHFNKSNNLLIKCRRRRVAGGSTSSTGDGFEYNVEVLGIVEGIISFNSPCDYQYLPVTKQPDGQYKEILSSIQVKFEDQREEYLSRDVPLFLPPISFSRKEKPAKFSFQHDETNEVDEEEDEEAIGMIRKSRMAGTQFVSFGDLEMPCAPDEKANANFQQQLNHKKTLFFEKVKELFIKRPLWSKTALGAQFDLSYQRQLKFVLPIVSYCITNGPWRQLWCRFGYNPNKDKSAKMYQTIDFRIRTAIRKIRVASKRGTDKVRSSKTNISKAPTDAIFKEDVPGETSVQKDGEISTQASFGMQPSAFPKKNLTFMFFPNEIPPFRQMRYQICDIHVEKVQQLLHQNDGQETECTERDGWCITDFCDLCRDILAECTDSLL